MAGRFQAMSGMVPEHVPDMRALAARLRGQAAETGMDLYRRKLEALAGELEEEAEQAESRAQFLARLRVV